MMAGRRQALAGLGVAALAGIGRPAEAGDAWDDLPGVLAAIESARGGRLGVAALDTATGRHAGHRAAERFPLTSTFKLLLAGAILARVDAGRESLDRPIRYDRTDLLEWSPVTGPAVAQGALGVAVLLEAILTISDNTAANLLLTTIDGPAGLTALLRSMDDDITRLDRLEPALNEAAPGDPRDTTSPRAMLANLHAFTLGQALAPASQARLQAWMRANRTGDARLPEGWQAGDRTGGGGFHTSNVVGLLWPPGRRPPVLVAAYLTEGAADGAVRDAALADVGAAVAQAAA